MVPSSLICRALEKCIALLGGKSWRWGDHTYIYKKTNMCGVYYVYICYPPPPKIYPFSYIYASLNPTLTLSQHEHYKKYLVLRSDYTELLCGGDTQAFFSAFRYRV